VIRQLHPYLTSLPAYGRQLLIEALQKTEKWSDLINFFPAPTTPHELTALVYAYAEIKQWPEARAALNIHAEQVGLPELNRRDLVQWLDVQEEIRR
jgi:hypothetical protein